MNRSIVAADACVLYPAPLRDLIMQFVPFELFRVRWTEEIHAEWMNSLLANRSDLSRDRIERTWFRMDHQVLDALVTDYEPLIPGLTLPDPNDRHVLAAAIHCGGKLILTNNLKDFLLEPISQLLLRIFGNSA